MSGNHVLQTDRQKQWQKMEENLSKSASRKDIKICRDCFFDNNIKSDSFRWSDRFVLYFNPTLEGWQKLFDEELDIRLEDSDFLLLQSFFSGQLADDFFCVEDQGYYFKAAFGLAYDRKKRFALRVNREKEARINTFTPNVMLSQLTRDVSFYLRGNREDGGLVTMNLEYLESLLPLVDSCLFSLDKNVSANITSDGVRPLAIQSSIETVIRSAYSKPSKKINHLKINAANQVLDVLLQNSTKLGDFSKLHDQVCDELEKKSKKK